MNQTQQIPRSRPSRDSAPVSARRLAVQSFGLTDRGLVRETNEDDFVITSFGRASWIPQSSVLEPASASADDRGHVFIVADGMGGARGGAQASALAVSAVEACLLQARRRLLAEGGADEASVLGELEAAVRSADASVCAAAIDDPGLRGMGTTLTMAFSRGADLFVAHAGDSRCYLLRGGALHHLTRDDTLVQQLIEAGVLQPEMAAENDYRHVITNVVGGSHSGVHVELHRMRLERGDVLLLCTDGLTDMIADDGIAAILQSAPDPQQACEELVRIANERGGKDNVTVVTARYA